MIARWLTLFSFLIAFSASSTEVSQKKPPPPLQHEVRVALKLVQVIVSDRAGQPVTDLQASDFVLRDNGQNVAITAFEKHFLPSTSTNRPTPSSGLSTSGSKDTGRKFFFLMDAQQSDPIGYAQAKKAALHFLDTRIEPDDEVGLLSYQVRRGLIMHAFLSRDHDQIKQTLRDLRTFPGTDSEGFVTDSIEEENTEAFLLDLQMSPLNAAADEAAAKRMNYVAVLK